MLRALPWLLFVTIVRLHSTWGLEFELVPIAAIPYQKGVLLAFDRFVGVGDPVQRVEKHTLIGYFTPIPGTEYRDGTTQWKRTSGVGKDGWILLRASTSEAVFDADGPQVVQTIRADLFRRILDIQVHDNRLLVLSCGGEGGYDPQSYGTYGHVYAEVATYDLVTGILDPRSTQRLLDGQIGPTQSDWIEEGIFSISTDEQPPHVALSVLQSPEAADATFPRFTRPTHPSIHVFDLGGTRAKGVSNLPFALPFNEARATHRDSMLASFSFNLAFGATISALTALYRLTAPEAHLNLISLIRQDDQIELVLTLGDKEVYQAWGRPNHPLSHRLLGTLPQSHKILGPPAPFLSVERPLGSAITFASSRGNESDPVVTHRFEHFGGNRLVEPWHQALPLIPSFALTSSTRPGRRDVNLVKRAFVRGGLAGTKDETWFSTLYHSVGLPNEIRSDLCFNALINAHRGKDNIHLD